MRHETALFIDDDPQAQDTLKMVLADDYQVISSLTGEQGIEIVRDENPDFVLLDINLPDLDGLEVLKRIMGIPAPPPVVILTGYLISNCIDKNLLANARSNAFSYSLIKTNAMMLAH